MSATQQSSAIVNPTTSDGVNGNMSEIQALEERVRVLGQSADWWNDKMIWGLVLAALAAVFVVVTTVIALRRSGQKDDAQSDLIRAKDRQLALDLRDKDLKIAQVNEEFNLKFQEEQQKTAVAQRATAEAQLALKRAAEYAATPRRIVMQSRVVNEYNDQELRAAAFNELKKYADTPTVILYIQEEEAQVLAGDIRAALAYAGWKSVLVQSLASTPIPLGFVSEGVQIRTWLDTGNTPYFPPANTSTPPPLVTALFDLLKLDLNPPIGAPLGVRWEPEGIISGKYLTGLARYGFNTPRNGVVISVGRKPTEQLFWGLPEIPTKSK